MAAEPLLLSSGQLKASPLDLSLDLSATELIALNSNVCLNRYEEQAPVSTAKHFSGFFFFLTFFVKL